MSADLYLAFYLGIIAGLVLPGMMEGVQKWFF